MWRRVAGGEDLGLLVLFVLGILAALVEEVAVHFVARPLGMKSYVQTLIFSVPLSP